jgi:hypothetical protein
MGNTGGFLGRLVFGAGGVVAKSKKTVLYWVEWVDSYSPRDRWYQNNTDLDEAIKDPAVCVTVGFLVRETRELLTFVQTVFPEMEQLNGVMVIPRGCIRRKKRIASIA